MGHRANYVVIRDGKVRAFQDQWGALGAVLALVDGPEEARKIAEENEPTRQLMEWMWAEGGYLLDFDRKVALMFGVPDIDLDMLPAKAARGLAPVLAALDRGPKPFLTLIAPRFPGWTLRWDERGVDAFADHLEASGLAGQLASQPRNPDPDTSEVVELAPKKPPATKKKPPAKKPPVKKPRR